VRRSQQQWLTTHAGASAVQAAVVAMEDELYAAIDDASDGKWPTETIGAAILGALLAVFVGDRSTADAALSAEERMQLLSALAGYRKRQNAPPNPFATKLDYAKQVRELLRDAIARTGCSPAEVEERLPLLVSACVGGGEIFPLLMHWTVRRLALEPQLQAEIRAELGKSSQPYGSRLPRTLAAVLRQCPYSLAIGPPRKALENFIFRDWLVPADSLVFAMHPGVTRAGPLPPLSAAAKDTTAEKRVLRMFGAGPRSCTAAETSLAFMCSALASVLKRYEIQAGAGAGAAATSSTA